MYVWGFEHDWIYKKLLIQPLYLSKIGAYNPSFYHGNAINYGRQLSSYFSLAYEPREQPPVSFVSQFITFYYL